MPDEVTPQSSANPWNVLLDETRRALSHLRAEDLEELAARAECMLLAIAGDDPVRQQMTRPEYRDMPDLGRGHHLLGDLLLATGKNLTVLQQTMQDTESRWAR